MDGPLPNVLLIGQADHAEMQPVAETLADLIPNNQLFHVATIAEAATFAAEREIYPAFVIVCQTWPDEYAPSEAGRLFELYPLAVVLCCYGSWCDSDGRNRHIWPPAVRVPVQSSPALIRELWENLIAGEAPLPFTASIEDVFLRLHGQKISPKLGQSGDRSQATIEVVSGDTAIRQWLQDALRAAGFQVATATGATMPDATVWDAAVWDERAAEELRQFHEAAADRPLLVLIGGAWPHKIEQARACGADCVLPKIAPITTVLEQLAALTCSPATHGIGGE